MAKIHFLELNEDEAKELNRRVNGVGGFEGFLRRLQKKLNPATRTLKLDDKDLIDIPHYAFDYKQGGFESRLLAILAVTRCSTRPRGLAPYDGTQTAPRNP